MTAFEHCNEATDRLRQSSFQSLQKFVDTLNEHSERSSICQLVSSDDEDEIHRSRRMNSTITEINTIIFRPAFESSESCDTTYAVAIVPSSNKIDVRYLSEELSKLQGKDEVGNVEGDSNSNNYYNEWELAPAQTVRDLCGYEPGTIPPLLVPYRKNGALDFEIEETRRPFATIIDSSLLWRKNSTKVHENREMTSHLLLGGGGSADYRCLIDVDFLVRNVLEIENFDSGQSSTRNTKIASIIQFDGGMTVNGVFKTLSPSSPGGTKDSFGHFTESKPFFQIAPPPGSLVGEGSTKPHRPIPVTAIGRLTSVRQIAKKLVFADFAPPDYNYNEWLVNKNVSSSSTTENGKNYDKSESGMLGPPWRSGEDGKDMYVQIIVGKTFCERFEDGTARLKSLKAGKLVLVRGAANVGK